MPGSEPCRELYTHWSEGGMPTIYPDLDHRHDSPAVQPLDGTRTHGLPVVYRSPQSPVGVRTGRCCQYIPIRRLEFVYTAVGIRSAMDLRGPPFLIRSVQQRMLGDWVIAKEAARFNTTNAERESCQATAWTSRSGDCTTCRKRERPALLAGSRHTCTVTTELR